MDDMDRLHADIAALRDELGRQGVSSARIEERLRTVEDDVRVMVTGADARFVSRGEFDPVRKVVFGVVMLFLGGLVSLGLAALVNGGGALQP